MIIKKIVTEICADGRYAKLKKPLEFDIVYTNFVIAENHYLNINIVDDTIEDLDFDIAFEMFFLYDNYVLTSDELTNGAKELRNKILEYME
jgi:hypothetical protein